MLLCCSAFAPPALLLFSHLGHPQTFYRVCVSFVLTPGTARAALPK